MKIILMAAISIDGKIAKNKNQKSTDWTSKQDKKIFVQTTKQAGVVIMGRKTYETIGKPLKQRLNIILTKNPKKYKNIPNQLEFHNKTPAQIIKYLEQKNYNTAVVCGGSQIYSEFLQQNLVNELYLTIEPKIFGKGINLFADYNLEKNLKLLEYTKLGENTIFLKYKIL